MKKFLLIFTFVFIILGALGVGLFILSLPTAPVGGGLTLISGEVSNVKCQEDVQVCENGGYASRDPLNSCQFNCDKAVSPSNGIIFCPQDVKQCEDGSFVIRNPNNKCEFKPC